MLVDENLSCKISFLVKAVFDAFSNVTYPVKQDFFQAIANRDYLELAEVKSGDEIKDWRNISKNDLLKYYDFIFFINSDDEKIYYIPSYITNILLEDEVADSQALDCLLMVLSILNTAKLTCKQYDVVSSFLDFLVIDNRTGLEHDSDLVKEVMTNYRVLAM